MLIADPINGTVHARYSRETRGRSFASKKRPFDTRVLSSGKKKSAGYVYDNSRTSRLPVAGHNKTEMRVSREGEQREFSARSGSKCPY